MKQSAIYTLVCAALTSIADAGTPVLASRATSTLTPITVTGNAFYNGTDRFYIRGVDYQPVTGDPLANGTVCKRDLPYFTQLGINTIRVYTVDNSVNHDDCMNALEEAGIYLVLDTDNSAYSLNRDDPKSSYNSVYLQSVFATIDAFANYSNTMAFLSGNEVINDADNTVCAPYVKAVTRDMRQYIGDRGYRQIPVGYSAADVSQNQQIMAEYMNCGTNDQRSDFYAINDYSWCDPSSFTQSGWDALVANYTGYGIPLFMSEYGCITNGRTFQEVSALYNTEMTGVFSGGLVYEYSQTGNGYGLVTVDGDTVTPNSDFTALQSAYAAQSNPTGNGGASSTSAVSTCPTESTDWEVANDDLPAMPSAAAIYLSQGAGPGPGLSGAGSQQAGDVENESAGTATAGSGSATASASGSSGISTSSAGTSTPSSTTGSKKNNAMRPVPLDLKIFSMMLLVVLGMVGGMTLL